MKYRYFCKLLEKERADQSGPVAVAISPLCSLKIATNFTLFLAYSLSSELNARVLLVDSTLVLDRNSLSSRLNAEHHDGFVQLALDKLDNINDQLLNTPVKNVAFLPSGATRENIREIFDHDHLSELLSGLSQDFDYVIYLQNDLRTDTRYIHLSNRADMNLLLVEEHGTLMTDIDECQKLYKDNNIQNFRLVMTSA